MTRSARVGEAFSLVEVTLALGVAAVCFIAIFGLLPVGFRTNQNAIQQSASADIISAVIADLRATPVTTPRGAATSSTQFTIAIPPNPVNAATSSVLYFTSERQASSSLAANARYRLTITFVPNSATRSATLVDLKMTWPAAANPTAALGSAEVFAALDRN